MPRPTATADCEKTPQVLSLPDPWRAHPLPSKKLLVVAQGRRNFLGHLAGADQIAGTQRDGRHTRVSAAAVFFTQRGEIHIRGSFLPGIRAHRDLGAQRRGAHAHRIERVREQKVRYEFVVTLEVQIADVKINYAVAKIGAFAKYVQGLAMALEQRPQIFLDDRQLDHLRQRNIGQVRNQLGDQLRFGRGLDYQRELGGRFRKADGVRGRGELRSINDIAPVNQVRERLGIESEFLRSDGGQKLGAGLVGGIVKLFAGMVLPEMFSVGGRQKRALVMVEPPGEQRRAGILEIHDGVFVAVKSAVLEGLRGFVRHPGIEKLGRGIDALLVKARENRGGGGSVEAFIVEANSDLQLPLLTAPAARNAAQGKANKDGRSVG